jgi:hypothetical protein
MSPEGVFDFQVGRLPLPPTHFNQLDEAEDGHWIVSDVRFLAPHSSEEMAATRVSAERNSEPKLLKSEERGHDRISSGSDALHECLAAKRYRPSGLFVRLQRQSASVIGEVI